MSGDPGPAAPGDPDPGRDPERAPAPVPIVRYDPSAGRAPSVARGGPPDPAPAGEPAGAAPPDPGSAPAGPTPGRGESGIRAALMLGLLAVVAFVTGLALFNGLVMPQLIHGRGEVRVPDLVRQSEEGSEQALREAGLRLSHAGERFDPDVPRGLVVQQDPPAGTPVRTGRRVSVVMSLGEEFSSVPPLFGTSLRGARLLVERSGLTVGAVTRAPSEDVGEGLVAGTDPPAESVLPRDAPVALLVSTGGGAESYVMPELLGRDLVAARRQLEAFGFRIVSPEGVGSRGMVVLQQPAAGIRVDRSTVITLQGNGRIPR